MPVPQLAKKIKQVRVMKTHKAPIPGSWMLPSVLTFERNVQMCDAKVKDAALARCIMMGEVWPGHVASVLEDAALVRCILMQVIDAGRCCLGGVHFEAGDAGSCRLGGVRFKTGDAGRCCLGGVRFKTGDAGRCCLGGCVSRQVMLEDAALVG